MTKSDIGKKYIDEGDVEMDDLDRDLPSYSRGRGLRSRGRFSSRGFRGTRGSYRGRGRLESSRSRDDGYRPSRGRGLSYRSRGGDFLSRSSFSPRGRGSALLKDITDLLSSGARLPLGEFDSPSSSYRGRGRGGGRGRGRGGYDRDYDDRPPKYSSPRENYSRYKSPPRSFSNGFPSRSSIGFPPKSKLLEYEHPSSRKYDDYRELKYKEDMYRGPPRHRDEYRRSSPPPRRIMMLRDISPPSRRHLSPPSRRMSPPPMRLSPGRHRYRSRSPIMRARSIEREERILVPRGGHRGWSPGSPRRRSPEFSGRPYKPPMRKESFGDKDLFFKGRGGRGYGRPREYPSKSDFRPKESYGGPRY